MKLPSEDMTVFICCCKVASPWTFWSGIAIDGKWHNNMGGGGLSLKMFNIVVSS